MSVLVNRRQSTPPPDGGPGVMQPRAPFTPGQTADPIAPSAPQLEARANRGPIRSRLGFARSTIKVGAAVVSRVPRTNGLVELYGHGGVTMPPGPSPQQVRSSLFQTLQLGPIVNVFGNNALRAAGFPISGALLRPNPGWTIRTGQPATSTSGGPAQGIGARMRPQPRLTKVQTIPRYQTQPARYPTTGGNG